MSTEVVETTASDAPAEPTQQSADNGNFAAVQPASSEPQPEAQQQPQPEAPQQLEQQQYNDSDFAVIELSSVPQNPAEVQQPAEPQQPQTFEHRDAAATEPTPTVNRSASPEAGQLVMPSNWPMETRPQTPTPAASETKPKEPKPEPETEPEAEGEAEAEPVVEEEQAEIDPNTLEELDLQKIRHELIMKALPYCIVCLLVAGALIFVIYYTYNLYNYYSQQVSDNQGTSTSTICFTLTDGSQYCTNSTSTTTATTTTSTTTVGPSIDLNSLENKYIISLAFFYISAICTGFSLTFVIVVITIALDKYEQNVKANDRIKRLKAAAPKMNLFDALFKNVKQEQADAGADGAAPPAAEQETEAPAQVASATHSRPASRVQSANRAPSPTNQASSEFPPLEPIQRVASARSTHSKLANSRPQSAARSNEAQQLPNEQGANTPRVASKRPSIASPVRVTSPRPNAFDQVAPADQKQLPEIQA